MSKHDIGQNPYTFTEFTASDANMRKGELERLRAEIARMNELRYDVIDMLKDILAYDLHYEVIIDIKEVIDKLKEG